MIITLPGDVQFILNTLFADGCDAYAVGGCVRDSLMGVAPQDWDITTSALPQRVKQLFTHTFDTGIKHGTVTVVLNRTHYEVTTFRTDGDYLDGRHPSSVAFTACVEDDLSRRDFTMNAIAYNSRAGFVDPFHGQDDIGKKIIRCVGKAEQRFEEDALRMLRAVRFAAQLGFSIDPETLAAVIPLNQNLKLISAERIREELTRLLTGRYPQAAFLLETTGLMPYVLQGRPFAGNLPETLRLIEKIPKETALVFALFLWWSGDEAKTILQDLRFDNKMIRETSAYIKWLPCPLENNRYALKKLLHQLSFDMVNQLLTLKIACAVTGEEVIMLNEIRSTVRDIAHQGECYRLSELAVNGDDLVALGVPKGKPTGDMLAWLLEGVMRDPSLNTREMLTRMAIPNSIV